MIGIWDDHDYGENNSGKYFTRKRESKTLMLNFLGVPDTAEVRNREGIYQSYKFGPPEQQVQFIMLDTRYFRDDPDLKNGDYLPSKGDILGEQQWKWLETTLMHSKAKIIFIASGYQIIPTEHRFEKWNNFPKSRQRLFHTIKAADCSKVILLSGDRHAAEISKIRFEDHPYPIYEFTSSGLTHSRSGNSDFEPNTFRMGDQWNEINFGIIQLDWEITPVKILMQIFSKEGNLLEEQSAIF
jgi:alkaline phosphatase D